MTKLHSAITEDNELHFPKGFIGASTSTQRAPVKNTDGSLAWVPTDAFSGVPGPAGPSMPVLEVVNIYEPSELNTLDDTVSSQYIVIQKGVSSTDRDKPSTYIYQSGATMDEYPPFVVNGLNGKWMILGGEYQNLTILESASTSVLSGGIITVNVSDPATFDISDTLVEVVDNYTDNANPKVTLVFVPATIGITVDNLISFERSYIFVTKNGLVQTTAITDASFFREGAFLGTLFHSDNVSIGILSNIPSYSLAVSLALDDLTIALGAINQKGNVYLPAGASLEFAKTAGSMMQKNVNSKNSLKNPNFSNDIVLTGGESFLQQFRDGAGGFDSDIETILEPGVYDTDTGTLVPVTATYWTLRRFYWSPSMQFTVVVVGQTEYATKDAALDAVSTSTWELDDSLNYFSHRATLAVIAEATDLSDSAQAVFTAHGKFGGGSVAAGAPTIVNLQDAYDNSNGAPIITTLSGNPLTIRRGGGASTTVLDIKNDSDISIFDINTSGAITGTNATTSQQGLMSNTDKTKLDAIISPLATTTDLPEGTNLYYTEAKVTANTSVAANTAKVSADGLVTTHSDVTSAGSGAIITIAERSLIPTFIPSWIQYSNLGAIVSAGETLSLNNDQSSNLGTSFTKQSATEFRTAFTGNIRLSFKCIFDAGANDATFSIIVQKNGADIAFTSSIVGGGRGGTTDTASGTFLIDCLPDDDFSLVYLSIAGGTQTSAANESMMLIERVL